MTRLKSILNSNYFFPAIALYYGIFYILFGEQYPFKAGFSTDGRVFESFVYSFTESYYFDSYYVHRILPAFLIRTFFKLFSNPLSEPAILLAFQILNILSLIISCYFLKQLFTLLKVTLKNQLLFFLLFFFNFGVIKYHFYFPSMTDQLALMLSTILLYFYLRNNITGIIISTIALAFTWPMAYYLGLILIAFPVNILPYSQIDLGKRKLIYFFSALYILTLIVFFVFIMNAKINVLFVAQIDRRLFPLILSIIGTTFFYLMFAKLFFNKMLFDIQLFLKKLNYKRLLTSAGVFILVYVTVKALHPKPTYTYSISQTLTDPVTYSLIRPLITIVADVSYFGVIVCILIFFWTSFCKTLSQMGWGLVIAVGFNLFLFGAAPQSRHLVNLLPWITVFLAKALDKYSFSKIFYITVGILGILASKVWLKLNIYADYKEWAKVDENGNLGFPDQILWMNIGPWMNEQMYYLQGAVALILIGILFFILYKIERNDANQLRIVKKYHLKSAR
jgi:hypothetical protein